MTKSEILKNTGRLFFIVGNSGCGEILPETLRLKPNLKVIIVSVPLEITMHRMITCRRETENERSFLQRLQRAKANYRTS
jgi:ribose 1,5-bisphosphokinase PhnN